MERNDMAANKIVYRSPEEDEEICWLYKQGYSTGELAIKFHWAPNTIRGILRKYGVKLTQQQPSSRKLKQVEVDKVVWLYRDMGLSIRSVSRVLGIPDRSIMLRLDKGFVKRRSHIQRAPCSYQNFMAQIGKSLDSQAQGGYDEEKRKGLGKSK
jgi:hypothetical protein